MADNEIVGGVGITVDVDFSPLDAQFDAALAKAKERSDAMASAIQDGVKAPDVSPVTNALGSIATSAQTTGQTVESSLKFEPPTIDISQAQGSLAALAEAVSSTSAEVVSGLSQIQAPAIDTAPAVASLDALAASVQSTVQQVSADFANAATGEEAFNAALAGLVNEGSSVNEAFQQLTGSSQSFMSALASGELAQFMADFGKVAADSQNAAAGLQDVAGAAQAAAAAEEQFARAEENAGNAAGSAGAMLEQFSQGARDILESQRAADQELENAKQALSDIQAAYSLGEASAEALARAEKGVEDATRSANPALKESGDSAKDGAAGIEEMAKQLVALGQALAVTAGLVEFGKAAIEAADHVDDATRAISALGKGSGEAEIAVDQLRAVAKDEALSLPQTLIAAQRMTAFLGSAQQVPAILSKLGDSAAAMGSSLTSASGAFETIIAKGEISAKTLKTLGLTMDDLGKSMGTTADQAKAAFSALDQQGKIDALSTALGKFNGLAKEMNDDALGSMVRLGQAWDEVLEEIGKALDPVIKQLADFVSEDVIGNIKALAEAFNQLPEPVKEISIAVGIAVAAIAPLTAGAAALALSFSALQGILPAVTGLLESFGLMASTVAVEEGAATVATEALSTAAETAGAGLTAVGGIIALGVVAALTAAVAGFADLKAAMADTEEQAKKTDTTFQQWLGSLGKAAESLEDIRVAQDKVKASLDAGAISAENAKKLLDGLTDSMKALTAEQNKAIGLDMSTYLKGVGVSVQDLGAKLGYTDAQAEANVITMQRLRDNLEQAKQKLVDTTDAWNKDQKSSLDVANAYDAVNKAQQQLNTALGEGAGKIQAVSDKFIAYNQALRDFHDISASVTTDEQSQSDIMTALSNKVGDTAKSLDNAKQNLGLWVDELNNAEKGSSAYALAQQQVDKWLAMVEKDQTAANKALDDFNSKSGVAATNADGLKQGFLDAQVAIETAGQNLTAMGVVFDGLPPKMDPVNKALIDFGFNAQAAGKPAVDLRATVGQLVDEMPSLDAALAQNRISLDQFDTAVGNVFSNIQKLAKSDLPAAIRDVSKEIQDLINNQHWDQANAGVQVYQGLIDKLARTNLPAAIAAEQDLINKLIAMKAPLGDILDAEQKELQFQISAAEKAGENADEQVLALEKVKLKQEELKLASHGYADAIVAGINDMLKGFDSLAGAMAGAVVDGKNLGDALVGAFKKIGQSLLTDVLQAGMVPLKLAMEDLISKMLPNLNLGFQVTGASARALSDAMATQASVISGVVNADLAATAAKTANTGATTADTGATVAATSATVADTGATVADTGATIADTGATIANTAATVAESAADIADTAATIADTTATIAETAATIAATVAQIAFASVVTAVSAAVGAIAGIIGDVYLAAIDTKLFHVETSLLEIRNTVENSEADAWSQFGQMYLRLGECKNALDSISDSVKQLKLSGGQFPDQALTDLNDIAAAARQSYAILPTILGALGTIASDIVTYGGYIYSDLDVIVQKLGQIITNGLTANDAISNLVSASDIQASANDIISSMGSDIGDASSQASAAAADLASVMGDSSTAVTGAVADAGDVVAGQVAASSADMVSAVDSAGAAIDNLTTQVGNYSSQVTASMATAGGGNVGVVAAINGARDATAAALEKQLAEAQKIAESGGSTLAQMKAMQDEITAYQKLIANAVADGNQRLADGYRTASAAVQAQLDQMIKSGALTAEHTQALRDEIKLDTDLMNRAIQAGNLALAESYRQAAQNATSELLPLLSQVGSSTSETAVHAAEISAAQTKLTTDQAYLVQLTKQLKDATDAQKPGIQAQIDALNGIITIDQSALTASQQIAGRVVAAVDTTGSQMAFAATGAGQLVSMHVDAAAVAISAAVSKAPPASFTPNPGGGTTTPFGGTTTPAAGSTVPPGTATGTQPGFGPTGPLVPTNAPTTPSGPGTPFVVPNTGSTNGQNIPVVTPAPPAPYDFSSLPIQPGAIPVVPAGNPLSPYGPTSATPPASPGMPSSLPLQPIGGGGQIQPFPGTLQPIGGGGQIQPMPTAMPDMSAVPGYLQSAISALENAAKSETGAALAATQALIAGLLNPSGGSGAVVPGNPNQGLPSGPVSGGGTSSGGAGTPASTGPTMDPQLVGYWSGLLAEEEDIRTTIHSLRDITGSMRDSWVAFQTTSHNDSMIVGQAIIDAIGGKAATPLKSFDLGGSVGMDMVAQLHAGEEVLAPDISQALRRMISTPSGGMHFANPAASDSKGGSRVITINAPITINGAKGGRANAEEFVTHLRRIIPDSNGFSS